MTDVTKQTDVDSETSIYDELPDAPPKQRLKLTWVGKLGVAIVGFWLIMVLIGPYVAPFHEADIIADDSYLPPDGTYWLGTDYLERDILSRVLWPSHATERVQDNGRAGEVEAFPQDLRPRPDPAVGWRHARAHEPRGLSSAC